MGRHSTIARHVLDPYAGDVRIAVLPARKEHLTMPAVMIAPSTIQTAKMWY
jgi:hypothetical protein